MTHRLLIAAGTVLAASLTTISARQTITTISVDADDIAGVVRSTKGPEAGVWVIAETKDLPTPYAKIVVTDDQGRYRSEEHTSELQSPCKLVCRRLPEKKKKMTNIGTRRPRTPAR